jgi:hypothetical protein
MLRSRDPLRSRRNQRLAGLVPLLLLVVEASCQRSSPTPATSDPSPSATSAATPAIAGSTPPSSTSSAAEGSAHAEADLPPPKLPPFSSGVVVNLRVEDADSGMPIIAGETNYPDGGGLIFQVTDDVYRACPPGRPCVDGGIRQAKGTVRNGRFRSVRFATKEPLHPGRWEASITIADAVAQPPEVLAVIGQHGERLKGKLVKKDEFFISVEATKFFQVPAR